jgi:hypothetical protein
MAAPTPAGVQIFRVHERLGTICLSRAAEFGVRGDQQENTSRRWTRRAFSKNPVPSFRDFPDAQNRVLACIK